MPWEHSETVEIAASATEVYNAVRDLERMGEWSPENQGGSWIVGDGQSVGDRFEGNNAALGVKALAESDVDIIAATSLTDAVEQAVKAVGGAA